MTDYQDQNLVFVGFLLTLYLLSLVGNIFIVAAANFDPQLHYPMYFFLSNLSFVDLCLTSANVPKCLTNLLSKNFHISFNGCITQIFLVLWLATTESFLLVVMSYDRYVAVCKPLHYILMMSKTLCFWLVVASWLLPFLHALLHVSMIFRLCFCGPNDIQGFFCDLPPLLELSCSDTYINYLVLLLEGSFLISLIFFFTIGTYVWIIISILRLRSIETRKKAFLTCSSHLTVIVLFYGTAFSVYFLPPQATSKKNSIIAGIMYALVTPMLNPFIYSLPNKEIKAALKKALVRKPFHPL